MSNQEKLSFAINATMVKFLLLARFKKQETHMQIN
jgi:hypothetical protein